MWLLQCSIASFSLTKSMKSIEAWGTHQNLIMKKVSISLGACWDERQDFFENFATFWKILSLQATLLITWSWHTRNRLLKKVQLHRHYSHIQTAVQIKQGLTALLDLHWNFHLTLHSSSKLHCTVCSATLNPKLSWTEYFAVSVQLLAISFQIFMWLEWA